MIRRNTRRSTAGSSGCARTTIRTGATLTEVLMSLLIMAVGVISVLTLFPLSILQAVSAHNHTQAKLLKFNATEAFHSSPITLNNHRPPGLPAITSPRTTPRFMGFWQPNNLYTVGDIVLPTVKPGSQHPSPNLWFICVDAQDGSGNPPDGVSGQIEPAWSLSTPTNDVNLQGNGFATWAPLPAVALTAAQVPYDDPTNLGGIVPLFSPRAYVVDPLGWAIAADDGYAPSLEFGNKANTNAGVGVSVATASDVFSLLRINGGLNTVAGAAAATTLPDSWETVVEETPDLVTDADPSGPTAGSAVFPATVDLSGIGVPSRIVFTSVDGVLTVVRDITGVNPGTRTVTWSALQPFPVRFPRNGGGDPVVGTARIETFDRRYSWFITVKKEVGGRTDAKMAVVFRRSLSAEDEHIYDANFGNPVVDIDGEGTADGAQHGLGSARGDWVKIAWDPNAPNNEPHPFLKPGTFLFDARNVEWYRVREVFDVDETATPPFAVLILDAPVRQATPGDGTGAPEAASPPGRAMIMKRIVDVYDL